MLSGIENAFFYLKEQMSIQPEDEVLQEIFQGLKTLEIISQKDRITRDKINDFCTELQFGSASSSHEKSPNQIALERINALLQEFQGPQKKARVKRGFMPGFNQAQSPIEQPKVADNEINNYCSIFENESRFTDKELIFDMIKDLASKEDADKAPMPVLTRCAIQGGGAKGAAYAGTYEAMDMLGVTDTTQTYCGASAGAITSFSMGLGYSSEQFKAISSSMNFQDLADYNPSYFGAKVGGTAISQAVSAVTQLHVHSGVGFHNWAKGQCAMVFGDPDITFIEMQEWYQARGLPAPEMVFMGSMVAPDSKKVVFSAIETPHIRIADAVRASMSFPIAWEQFDVKYGKSISRTGGKKRNGDIHGRYADGGILNNFPIDELNTVSENPAYNKPICKDASEVMVPHNASSYGFSLTSKLSEFDERKTPMTKRLHVLKQRAHGRASNLEYSDEDFERRTTDSKLQSNKFWNLMSVLKKNFVGDTATSVLDHRKREIFDRQTSLIYTEGVGTLEFNLTPHKKKLIEDSGKFAFINWFIKYRNPSQTYDEFYHSKNIGGDGKPFNEKLFQGDSTLNKTDLEKLDTLGFKDKQASALQKYCRLMIDIHDEFAMLRKVVELNEDPEVMAALSEDQKQRLAQFNDLNNNQRLKHLSWQIEELAKKYPFLKEDQALAINKIVLDIIRDRSQQKKTVKLLRKQELDENISKDGVIHKIHDLLAQNNPDATNLAIVIFKGQMSGMFELMKMDPSLFSSLSQNCNTFQLEDLLETLRNTAHQLDQQGRRWHGDFGLLKKLESETLENFADRFQMFMEKFAYPSPLEVAIKEGVQDKINFILKQKSKSSIIKSEIHYFNPLAANKEGKNALHICIDMNNFDTFSQILFDVDSLSLPFAANGQHLLHYVIENGSAEFISQLFNNPQTSGWIQKVIYANSKTNPEFCTRFGCGESLREQIIRVAATKNLALDFNKINEVLKLKSPINTDVVKLYDPEVDSSAIQKDVQYLQGFLDKNVEPTNIPEFGPAQALRCLTLPYANGKILMELAAADDAVDKPYLNLALKLISICQKDPLINAKLNELYKVKFADDKTLLYLAVEHHNPSFVDVCLANGSDINTAGPFHLCSSALTCAASIQDFELVEKIISSKVPFARSISDNSGKNALHYLAMDPTCPAELYIKLASKGAKFTAAQYLKIDSPNSNGFTPFDYLIKNNRYDIIDSIISQKTTQTWYVDNYFNVFNIGIDGKTSLQNLVEKAATESADVDPSCKPLLKLIVTKISEAGLTAQDSNGKTVLHYLAESDKGMVSPEEFSNYLVKGTKSVIPGLSNQSSATYHNLTGIEDNNANSIFRSIINNNRHDIIEYLKENWKGWHLNAIFDLQTVRSDGLSDFEYLMKNVNPEKTPELFTAINTALPPGMQRDEHGQTLLHQLIDEPNSANKVWGMLTAGLKTWSPTGFRESFEDYQAQTSLVDNNNQTLLRHIIVANRTDILEMLKDKTGSSLIGLATASARWYLDHYFDMTLTDENGVTDLEYASKNATPEVKNILFSRLSPDCLTPEMASRDSRGWSPLHYIANDVSIKPSAFWDLINRGQGKGEVGVYHERTNVEDVNGNTPFRLLIANNRIDVLKDLATKCGGLKGWWFDHYINMKVKRPDGMNDLEYLIFKAKSDPSLKDLLKLVEANTSKAVFTEATVSVNKNYEQFAGQVAELEERRAAQHALEEPSHLRRRVSLK